MNWVGYLIIVIIIILAIAGIILGIIGWRRGWFSKKELIPLSSPKLAQYSGYNLPGSNMSGMPLSNIAQETDCYNKCVSTVECDAYVYNPSTKQCWLKTIPYEAGSDTGVKFKGNPYYIKPNSNIKGFNISGITGLPHPPIPNSNNKACSLSCDNLAACQWYNLVGSDCYLKSATAFPDYNVGFNLASSSFSPAS